MKGRGCTISKLHYRNAYFGSVFMMVAILVICSYTTNYHKLSRLKTPYSYYFIISLVKEPRHDLTGSSIQGSFFLLSVDQGPL